MIRDKSQGSVGKRLSCSGIISDHCIITNLLLSLRISKIGEHLVKLQARRMIMSCTLVFLGTVQLKDEELARDLGFGRQQLFLTVSVLIVTEC